METSNFRIAFAVTNYKTNEKQPNNVADWSVYLETRKNLAIIDRLQLKT